MNTAQDCTGYKRTGYENFFKSDFGLKIMIPIILRKRPIIYL